MLSSLATKSALTAVANKIPNVSSMVKKTDYDTKISELETKLTDHNHDKYIFNARLAQANLIRKTDFVAKLPSLNRNITANKTKYLLVENALKKSFDSSQFVGKGHSDEEGS